MNKLWSMENDPLAILPDDPVGNSVHHPYTAFNQGWDANDHGYLVTMNPYTDGTREAHWWRMGFIEATEDPGLPLGYEGVEIVE